MTNEVNYTDSEVSFYVGKYSGACGKCNFSLLADSDTVCPRCKTKIKAKG